LLALIIFELPKQGWLEYVLVMKMGTLSGLLAIIMGAFFGLTNLYGQTEEEDQLLTERTSLRVTFHKNKDDEFVGKGDVDNRFEIFYPEVKVDPPLSLGTSQNNEIILIILGENVYDDEEWKVFAYETGKMDLADGEVFVWKGKKVQIEYDPVSPSAGFEFQYEGYVLLIKNSQGEVVFEKSTKSVWTKDLDRILKVKKDKTYKEDYFKGKTKK